MAKIKKISLNRFCDHWYIPVFVNMRSHKRLHKQEVKTPPIKMNLPCETTTEKKFIKKFYMTKLVQAIINKF